MPAIPETLRASVTGARIAYSPAEFAEAVGVTRQHVHNLIARGELRSIKLGSSRRIPVTEIARLLGDDLGGAA